MGDEGGAGAPEARRLTTLRSGQSGRVLRISSLDSQRLLRLSGLGIVPGAVVRLRQKLPATVIQVAETAVAIDAEIASEIWVKRLD